MNEAISSAIKRVDLRPYIDELQLLEKTIAGEDHTSGQQLVTDRRLQDLIRSQGTRLSRELGLRDDSVTTCTLAMGIISVAYSVFRIRRASIDVAIPFDESLEMQELANGIGDAILTVVESAKNYAELAAQ